MASEGSTMLAVSLGAGGGLLLWYLLSGHKRGDTPSPGGTAPTPDPAPATPAAPRPAAPAPPMAPKPAAPAPSTSRACTLRLDASGLTADGLRMDIPGAVARCKVAGEAELTFAADGPAQVFWDLNRALTAAGVALLIKKP
jgi:hypothetical protein